MDNETILKQVNKIKATMKQGLNKNGERAVLIIGYNKELQEIFKQAVINEFSNFELYTGLIRNDDRVRFNFSRYRVKKVVYASLCYDYKDCLFIKDLIDKGKLTFEFPDFNRLEEFKKYFRKNLHQLLKTHFNNELSQTISFDLELEKQEEPEG